MELITYAILAVIAMILNLSYFIYKAKKQKKLDAEIRERIDDRIWSIPTTLMCQQCKTETRMDFDLGMYSFKCPECGANNRILIYFQTALESPDLNALSVYDR